MQRILIIGSGGAGKSTLAREIASRLQLPIVHLDALFWQPGWRKTEKEEWRRAVSELIAEPRWVMDGNFGGTLDLRLTHCDTVIVLNLPRLLCLWRVLGRRIKFHGRSRPDMSHGCPERLDWEFIRWIWTYPKRSLPGVMRQLAGARRDQQVIVLSSGREVRRFLNELSTVLR